jgi:excisionase family DNA binding protein
MSSASLEERQAEMRERMEITKQQFCTRCGSGHAAIVSVNEAIRYLQKDSYWPLNRTAEYLGISPRSLQRRRSEIPHYRLGRKTLFRLSDLDEWMARYRRDPAVKDLRTLLKEISDRTLAKRRAQKSQA